MSGVEDRFPRSAAAFQKALSGCWWEASASGTPPGWPCVRPPVREDDPPRSCGTWFLPWTPDRWPGGFPRERQAPNRSPRGGLWGHLAGAAPREHCPLPAALPGACPPGRGACPPGRGACPPGRGACPPGRGACPLIVLGSRCAPSDLPERALPLDPPCPPPFSQRCPARLHRCPPCTSHCLSPVDYETKAALRFPSSKSPCAYPQPCSCDISKDSLKVNLLKLECHFTWHLLKEDIDLFEVEETIGQQLKFPTTKSRLTLYNLLAYVKHLKGQNKEALECLKQAEVIIQHEHSDEKEVRSLVTWGNYAWVYYHMGQLKEAQKYIDKVENVCKKLSSPSNYKVECPVIDCEKGWALLKFGVKYYQKAKGVFEKALEAEPDNPEFNIGYATTMYRLDDFEREYSVKSFSLGPLRKAVTLNPDDAHIKVLLALKLQDVHAEAEGEKYIEEILDHTSAHPYVLRYAAKFYRRKNSWDKALELLKKALEAIPNSSFLHHQMGLCYKAQMIEIKTATCNRPKGKDKLKFDELITFAISHFKAAVEQDSKFVFAYIDLANMYAEGGQYRNAEDVFQKAFLLKNIADDNKYQIHFHYGRFQEFHQKSDSTAIHHYLEALKIKERSCLRPKLTNALRKLAYRTLRYNACDVQSLSALGFIHKMEGEKGKAAEYYEKAQKLDPENEEFLTALCELRLHI
ncbi:interferon-induced protein with tetratricopeptide repeats 5-like [Rhynchocyon petersi]